MVPLLYFFLAGIVASAVPIEDRDQIPEVSIQYYNGQWFNYTEDHPVLVNVDSIQVCTKGPWLLYGVTNYAADGLLFTTECTERYNQTRLRSARLAGLRRDSSLSSVSLYSGWSYKGENAVTFEEGIPNFSAFPIGSIITINVKSIEFFMDPNFEGFSVCWDLSTCENGICQVPDFFDNQFPWNVITAKSMTAGCSSRI